MDISIFTQVDITWVNYDEFSTALYGLTNLHSDNWMCMFRVRSYKEDSIRFMSNIINSICHSS